MSSGQVEQLAERGKVVLDFIQYVDNKLCATPEFLLALARDFFDHDIQQTPRYYGTNVRLGNYIYHISPFIGHYRINKPDGAATIYIKKYDAQRIESDHKDSYLGSLHASCSWREVQGIKIFNHANVHYHDVALVKPGIDNVETALDKGKLLIAELLRDTINF